jgi:selenocysteine lyase/cysteine desulfurase
MSKKITQTSGAAIATPYEPSTSTHASAPAVPPRATDTPSPELPLLPVLGGDLEVPLATGGVARYANLDYAATAPAALAVAERIARVQPLAGSVHRGAGLPSQGTSALYEAARRKVGEALGARDSDLVVFTRNTTDSTNLLASAVPAAIGDVIALDIEHHANLLPWQRSEAGLRCVEHASTIEATVQRIEAALAAKPAALLAITGASNVTGELLPVERLATLAHAHGARLFVDAAQLAPHRAVDLQALGADYVALSGHKLYAPYGSGVLVGRRDWLDAAPPYLAGGGAVREVTVERTDWHEGPARHEAGTPNLVGAVAIAAALDALGALCGPTGDARELHERALRERVLEGFAQLPGVRVLQIFEDSTDAIGTVTFTVDGHATGLVGAYLSAEHGIGVRDGRFCAHPLLARFGLQSGALRASFGVGSRLDDADRLVDAVRALVEDGPRLTYAQTASGWAPEHDPRDLSAWLDLA